MSNIPRKLIVGNWKMHTTVPEGSLLVTRIHKELQNFSYCDIVLCPPSTHLFALHKEIKALKTSPRFELGVQNISEYEEGAYTGEISAEMVKQFAKYTIIGHSERRKFFAETDIVESKKVTIALRHKLKPILCVGETSVDRTEGQARQVVLDRINTDLRGVTAKDLENLVIAYEPIWAIGNGNFAKPAQVEEMVMLIRNVLAQLYGRMASMNVKVLYGGSVDSDNAKSYLQLNGVDGFLVGSASLNYKNFAGIVKATQIKAGINL